MAQQLISLNIMQPDLHPTDRSVAARAAPILGLYTLGLYFHAATASLTDAYQPGIESLQVLVSPGALLLLVFLLAYFRKSRIAVRTALITSSGAVLVSALMLVFMANHGGSQGTWRFPEARSLSGTVRLAVFQPSFSNRSIGVVASNGLLALITLGGSICLLRQRSNNFTQ